MLALTCIFLAAGCASRRPVALPLGEWTGHGSFTYERWGEPEDTATLHRDYKTCLRMRKSKVDDQPATEIEIVSQRGELPELGERTHIRLALVETKRLSDSAVLYRVAGQLFDPKPDDQPKFEAKSPPVGASCIKIDGVTVLQIAYNDGFVDTFRFHGKGLMKAGTLTVEDGSIHWVETLVQRKPVDLLSGKPPGNNLAGG